MSKPVLQNLSPELVDRLKKLGAERSFHEDGRIFAQGESASFLPTVISGRIKMVRYPEPGKEVIIGTFGPGEIFAIPPALDGKEFPATAVAMESTRVLFVPRAAFLGLMDESGEFASVIMSRMCGILRDRSETIQILSTSSAEQRVGKVLLTLAEQENKKCPLRIGLRRQDIAEMAGLTLETAIRSIRKLAERELLTIVKGKVVLMETDGLRRFVQS